MIQRILAIVLGAWLIPLPVYAQNSAERVRANLDAQYQLMKQIIGKQQYAFEKPPPKEAFEMPCVGGDPMFHSNNKLVTSIGVLAGEMVQASRVLTWAEYPPSVWQDSLTDIEHRQLDQIRRRGRFDGDAFYTNVQKLVKKLAPYAEANPKLMKITWEPSCGGHGSELKVVTRPSGLSVQYLQALYYTFCTAQDVDPKNFRICNLWSTMHDGETGLFEGAYWYRVKRSNGSLTEPSRKDFSTVPETETRWMVSPN